jgi:hypothetical protein
LAKFNWEFAEFWGEYNLENRAYLKIGRFDLVWGLSPNFAYTNLPARIPEGSAGGEILALKFDVPIGIGGLQLLALTRDGFVKDKNYMNAEADDLGYGMKYNLAVPGVDLNWGCFYHADMRLRGFASLKTTSLRGS